MEADMRDLIRVGALAVLAAACSDTHTVAAPAASTIVTQADRAPSAHDQSDLRNGGVFAATNQPSGNSIAAYFRSADGSLTAAGMFPTGGLGAGGATDPLRAQGSLILGGNHGAGDDGQPMLFVVNAGSNEISVLAIGEHALTLVDKVPSGGLRPVSLTLHNDLLYVLHAGSGTINGFEVSNNGHLTPIPQSTRTVTGGSAADPSEVSFSPDGRLLVVTGKPLNNIDTYQVQGETPSGPLANHSAGLTPFGFEFDRRGHLVVSEAMGLVPGDGSASSYDVSPDGVVSVVSPSVHDTQTAPCWLVVTRNGNFAYVTNTASSNISSYTVGHRGELTLLNPIAATTDPASNPVDMALAGRSRFLYALNDITGTIDGFEVLRDGSLSPVGTTTGLPPNSQGIAAR
jgi:6-phosphogluconolactonase